MKKLIPATLLICLFALASCSKTEPAAPAEELITCNATGEAMVHRMVLNESGTEYFYYLEFDIPVAGESLFFPKGLPYELQAEGTKVKVDFGKLAEEHIFIVCLKGHQMDPTNPDVQSMPIVNLCTAVETKS